MKTISKWCAIAAPIMFVAAGPVGCATTPVPADKLARSQAAVKTAEEMNASSEPRAAVHLGLAKQQLDEGKHAMLNGDQAAAKAALERAEADGEAAYSIARAHAARLEAKKTIESIQEAMQQMQQNGSGS